MPTQITQVRCPHCDRRLADLSLDFVGAVAMNCRRCKTWVTLTPGAAPDTRLKCSCGRVLAEGVIHSGSASFHCQRHGTTATLRSDGSVVVFSRESRTTANVPVQPVEQPVDLVAAIEARWRSLRLDRAKRTVQIAIGLRFEILQRDDFRCRYCGRSPDEGVMLEVDHVIPRARGGLDTRENLVTACWDCNHGKRAKILG